MFTNLRISKRFSLLFSFVSWFFVLSLLIRILLLIWQRNDVSPSVLDFVRTILTGLFFDVGTASFVILGATLYFAIVPNRLIGSVIDKVLVWCFSSLTVFVLVLTFFSEITFWEEFKTRFNFIAVDYLIYTNEVVSNIEQSYPLPILISGVLILTAIFLLLFWKAGAFRETFTTSASFKQRAVVLLSVVGIATFFGICVNNTNAEWSSNRYNSEISKSGIYSFFAAFRNNQMSFAEFYTSIDDDKAFEIVRGKLKAENAVFSQNGRSIHRRIENSTAGVAADKNVVFILVESLSGSFLKEFGGEKNITPFLDSLAQKSIFFTNLYATGTRTVRGMEAVTLCIPPTPGQSIVKRPENSNLYTISNVFHEKGLASNFFYGGDGYFDNMNSYFGGNGFTIYDRGRGSVLSDKIKTTRHNIADNEVTFENAWGICDGDIFKKMVNVSDEHYAKNERFFNFVMTTSNHRPYTYPSNLIDIPSGTGRAGAVKYTDFALRKLFEVAKTKPWYKNTVFIIVADHCASSAGKDAIDIKNYHIPAFIVNMPNQENLKITKQCSQIDLFPTFFGLMKWNYESDFFGRDVLKADFEQRALVGTYRKLALLKDNDVTILSDQKKQAAYKWNETDNSLTATKLDRKFLDETIAWYQTADYLFSNKLLK